MKTLSVEIVQSDGHTKNDGKLYYHLFESDKGARKVEFAATVRADVNTLHNAATRFEIYQDRIYRWLNGRVDPDIPRYSEIPEEETASMLRGKVS